MIYQPRPFDPMKRAAEIRLWSVAFLISEAMVMLALFPPKPIGVHAMPHVSPAAYFLAVLVVIALFYAAITILAKPDPTTETKPERRPVKRARFCLLSTIWIYVFVPLFVLVGDSSVEGGEA